MIDCRVFEIASNVFWVLFYLVLFCNEVHRFFAVNERDCCFTYLRYCSVPIPVCALDWSLVCDCGIS